MQSRVFRPEMLRKREVARLLGIGLRSLNRNVEQGRFPRAIRLGTRTLRYSRRAVLAWIAEQSAGGAITK
jgi:predicted DNA-binding transcriptional regulator AlpA